MVERSSYSWFHITEQNNTNIKDSVYLHNPIKRALNCSHYLSHRCSPKVIKKKVVKRGCGPEVLVVQDGRDIIKHKPT